MVKTNVASEANNNNNNDITEGVRGFTRNELKRAVNEKRPQYYYYYYYIVACIRRRLTTIVKCNNNHNVYTIIIYISRTLCCRLALWCIYVYI